MTPLEFLKEEFGNVKATLRETLRHDYVPSRSKEFFDECVNRLKEISKQIEGLEAHDTSTIRDHIQQLRTLANWVALIERSHLGEFSWPFAMQIEVIAKGLLVDLDQDLERIPVVTHVIADGGSTYRILPEELPPEGAGHRFAIVSFPRQLKHHVLLHATFGHEIGHSALGARFGATLGRQVHDDLITGGALANHQAFREWLYNSSAPAEVRREMSTTTIRDGELQVLLENWKKELLCDLIGLLLFGPAFVAAHKVILCGESFTPYNPIGRTASHPPYALRRRCLMQALRAMDWHHPISRDQQAKAGEAAFMTELLEDPHDPWASVFDAKSLQKALTATYAQIPGSLRFKPGAADTIETLIHCLVEGRPPIRAAIDAKGEPLLHEVALTDILYAGWAYWHGRGAMKVQRKLTFSQVNHLCHLAILQQRAIDLCLKPPAAS